MIKCINNSGCSDCLTVGKLYEVVAKDDDFVSVIGDNGRRAEWYSSRFVEVSWVRCIDNSYYESHLTEGQVYEVSESDDNFTRITNDMGKKGGYSNCRFETGAQPAPAYPIDVATDDPTEVQKLIASVCDEIKDLLISKNRKYGNSALEPVRVFSKCSTIEQLNVRLDDKLSRILSSQEDEDEDVELDLVGYLILKRVSKVFSDKK